MAPIHESDVDEKRYHSSEWNTYEFWEKVEARLVWKRRLWFLLAILVFVSIAAVPVIHDTTPKWRAIVVARRLGDEISRLKREAGSDRQAYSLEFIDKTLEYQIFKSDSCESEKKTWVRKGSLNPLNRDDLTLLGQTEGEKLGFKTLLDRFCYDPLLGAEPILRGYESAGFGILPAKDLTDLRQDRIVFLLLNGPSAQITFE